MIHQNIKTNSPFTVKNRDIIFEIPTGVTVSVYYSVDGDDYTVIGKNIAGPETVQINYLVCDSYLKVVSDTDTNLKALI